MASAMTSSGPFVAIRRGPCGSAQIMVWSACKTRNPLGSLPPAKDWVATRSKVWRSRPMALYGPHVCLGASHAWIRRTARSGCMPRVPDWKTIASSPCKSTVTTASGPAPARVCFAAIRCSRICTFERQLPPGTTPHTTFFRFLIDRAGRIWVGSTSGLFRFDAGTWVRFTTADGLKADGVTHIVETADGAIWVGYREPLGISRLQFSPAGIQAQPFHQTRRIALRTTFFSLVSTRITGYGSVRIMACR